MSPDVGIKHIPISTKLPKKKSKYILLYLNVPFFKIAQKVTKYLAIFEIKFDVYTFQKYPNLVTLLYHLSFVFRLRMIKICDKCLSSITTGIRRRRRRRRWCHVNVKLFTITHRCVIYGKTFMRCTTRTQHLDKLARLPLCQGDRIFQFLSNSDQHQKSKS